MVPQRVAHDLAAEQQQSFPAFIDLQPYLLTHMGLISVQVKK